MLISVNRVFSQSTSARIADLNGSECYWNSTISVLFGTETLWFPPSRILLCYLTTGKSLAENVGYKTKWLRMEKTKSKREHIGQDDLSLFNYSRPINTAVQVLPCCSWVLEDIWCNLINSAELQILLQCDPHTSSPLFPFLQPLSSPSLWFKKSLKFVPFCTSAGSTVVSARRGVGGQFKVWEWVNDLYSLQGWINV